MDLKINKAYTYPGMFLYYFILFGGAIVLFLFEKGDLVIWLNERGTYFSDSLFRYWTWLGDGLIFLIPVLLFILRNYVFLFITSLAISIQTLFVQGLKRVIFSDLVRPMLYFDNFESFRHIDQVEFYTSNPFPSGHTATAFTCALIFSLYFRDKRWSLLFFILAAGVGISRIYLLQHFFVDVYFGSVFGVISALVSAYLILGNKYIMSNFSGRSLIH